MKRAVNGMAIVALAALMWCGCAIVQNNAGKTLATVATTVDAAMKGWATYVVMGQASASQEDQVRAAYVRYQACLATANAAYQGLASAGGQPAWEQALASLQGAQGTLLELVAAFSGGGGGTNGVAAAGK